MSLVLLVLAAIALAVATLLLFGVFSAAHTFGWLALGLFLWCLAQLAGAAMPYVRRGE